MKTIKELNFKVWYRLLKVLVIVISVFFSVMAVFVCFSEVGNYQNDYLVNCNYGNKTTFIANKDKRIYNIPTYNNYSYGLSKLPESTNNELRSACGISEEEVVSMIDVIFNGESEVKRLYDLTPTKVYTATYWSATLWSILGLIIILVVVEILKRSFYYVVLGNINPKKE